MRPLSTLDDEPAHEVCRGQSRKRDLRVAVDVVSNRLEQASLNGSRRPATIVFTIVAPYCFEVMLLSRGVIVSVECNDESVRERAVVD